MAKKINRLNCPICKVSIKREGNNFFPFCGARCKNADLYHWLTDKYKVSRPLEENDDLILNGNSGS
ncbi:MAG: DNA gyrase inhibitor YacG [bacterium]